MTIFLLALVWVICCIGTFAWSVGMFGPTGLIATLLHFSVHGIASTGDRRIGKGMLVWMWPQGWKRGGI